MKQDEIIEMARQADGQVTTWVNHSTIQKTTTFTFQSPFDYYVSGEYPEKYHIKFLEAFAKLVEEQATAKEREACAKVCDLAMLQNQEAINELEDDEHIAKCFIQGAMTQLVKTSKAIRARGKA